ncbi:MAG TPA: FKBP-type peptidyl-prolyl cis-trans isomerase [Gammaproteobacteria bacterium]|nr:FKBP-type peptidyl-prolyl cis-trans isomerase [Gammaproteobacteria bacterium]
MLRKILTIIGFYVLFQSSVLATQAPSRTHQGAEHAFLTRNQKKPGVHALPSGLQYRVIQKGDDKGAHPGPTDFVTVHYRGTLIDGTEFDSSYKRHAPASFAVNAVIPGWTEALQLMVPGAKWTIYVPAKLAYGTQAVGSLIKPNATLIFDIELLKVKHETDETPTDINDDVADGG